MKKFLPYFTISTIAFVFSTILSYRFHFALSNSWQAGVVLAFVFGPYWVYFWNLSTNYKKKSYIITFLLRFSLILLLIGYLISVCMFLIIGW